VGIISLGGRPCAVAIVSEDISNSGEIIARIVSVQMRPALEPL
jgi:hypothetical protein